MEGDVEAVLHVRACGHRPRVCTRGGTGWWWVGLPWGLCTLVKLLPPLQPGAPL